MSITGQPAMSLLDSALSVENTRVDAGVSVLKKAQDAMAQQGEAIVNLLEASGNPSAHSSLDAYA